MLNGEMWRKGLAWPGLYEGVQTNDDEPSFTCSIFTHLRVLTGTRHDDEMSFIGKVDVRAFSMAPIDRWSRVELATIEADATPSPTPCTSSSSSECVDNVESASENQAGAAQSD